MSIFPGVTAALHEDVQHNALLIDGPPQIVLRPTALEQDVVEVPLVAWFGTATAMLVRIRLAELPCPVADGCI